MRRIAALVTIAVALALRRHLLAAFTRLTGTWVGGSR
jgi:hypothetical protein